MLTFAVAAARPGRQIPSWTAALFADPAPACLAFTPHTHRQWSSTDGRTIVAAWQDEDRLGIGPRWEVRPNGITAVAGMTWHRATPWASTGSWASQLADLFEQRPLNEIAPELDGLFAALSLGADGTGTVTADPLGLTSLYRAEGGDVVVASNRALVAAQAITPPGRQAERDAEALGWIVYSGGIAEGRTGFTDVRRVPEGSILTNAPNRPLEVVTYDTRPWWAGPPVGSEDVDATIAQVGAAISERVVLAAGLPSDRRILELTGGHDSRLIFALALQAGVQHQFSYKTWGSDSLADVVIAHDLAERYDLDHISPGHERPNRQPEPSWGPVERFVGPSAVPPPAAGTLLTFDASIRHHVWTTSGGVSTWDRVARITGPAPRIAVCGLFGELLRGFHVGSRGLTEADQVLGAIRAGALRTDPGHLLRREVRADFDQRIAREILSCRGPGATVADAFDGHYLRNRLRPWYGAIGELEQRNRVFPFASPSVIRGAFSLGLDARMGERLAFELIRAADPELAKFRFAGNGWPESTISNTPGGPYPASPAAAPWDPAAPPQRAPGRLRALVRRPRRRGATSNLKATFVLDESRIRDFKENTDLLAACLDLDRNHRWFDIVDRKAVHRAFQDRDASLLARRALFDVATGAIWLDRAEVKGH